MFDEHDHSIADELGPDADELGGIRMVAARRPPFSNSALSLHGVILVRISAKVCEFLALTENWMEPDPYTCTPDSSSLALSKKSMRAQISTTATL